MKLARRHLRAAGWTNIKDTSRGNPFDLYCSKADGSVLYVEVKGTTSAGEKLILTRNEVQLHRDKYPDNALLVVHDIVLTGPRRDHPTKGTIAYVQPWDINEGALQVIADKYTAQGLSLSASRVPR